MGRIRTIKPEFPHSESMGRVSRDARLLFILLWTLCDDSGRTRGDTRMIASLLFPYDEDSRALANDREPSRTFSQGWIDELETEGCIETYTVGRDHYIQVVNWDSHQKIDRPSPSKFPSNPKYSTDAREDSRGFDEDSRGLDVGSRTKDQGSRTKDQGCETGLPGAATSSPGGGGDSQESKPAKKPRKPRTPAEPIMIPDNLAQHEDFAAAWDRWQQHRSELRKPMTPTSRNMLLGKLAKFGPIKAIMEIDRAITSGWTSIHEDTGHGTATGKKPHDTRPDCIKSVDFKFSED